jgi:hypothetical protein
MRALRRTVVFSHSLRSCLEERWSSHTRFARASKNVYLLQLAPLAPRRTVVFSHSLRSLLEERLSSPARSARSSKNGGLLTLASLAPPGCDKTLNQLIASGDERSESEEISDVRSANESELEEISDFRRPGGLNPPSQVS